MEAVEKVGDTRTSLLRKASLPKTNGRVRRMRHRRNTHAFHVTVPIESLNALNRESLPPWCKEKKIS